MSTIDAPNLVTVATPAEPELLQNDAYIAAQNQVMRGRIEKMKAFAEEGVHPFANGFTPGNIAAQLQQDYGKLSAEELAATSIEVSVAGRIMAIRGFGKASFIQLKDRSAGIQAHVRKDAVGDETYEWFKKLDVGDIVAVSGTLFMTRTEELTIRAKSFKLLTKSLRPLPEKWHGLTDVETRLRQRYVDCIVNDDVRKLFETRAAVIRNIRAALDERSFLEVETPMMHPTPGGAVARPFVTHHNALGIDLFLRIAPELYLKRLIVGGFERVYEINRNFRNEGLSRKHNPEFTMLEFYWAYATYEDLMDFTEELMSDLCVKVLGKDSFERNGETVSFARPWRRLSVREGVSKATGVAISDLDKREVLETLARTLPEPLKAETIGNIGDGYLLMEIFDQKVEHTLVQPTFVFEYPAEVSPLSRRNDTAPRFVDRFELVIAGMEVANAFNELNDPLDQRQRFLDQLEAKAVGNEETHPMDDDYVRALEYGMPPTAGEGIGIDRLGMLLTGAESIREVILFPQLRPEQP